MDVVVLVDFGPKYDLESDVGFAGVVMGVYVSLLHGEEEALGDLPTGTGCGLEQQQQI